MALPKRRFSRSRRDKRRLQDHLTVPALTRCARCGAWIQSHQLCRACGYYRGRQVMAVASKPPQEKK